MSRTGLVADEVRRRRSIIVSLHESDILPVDLILKFKKIFFS